MTIAQQAPNLRILTLGDSITRGSGSSDLNGYRNRLQKKLLAAGPFASKPDTSIDMIGTLNAGSMIDNDNEGHSGNFLEDIVNFWQRPILARPNLVLIHAGTNNMDFSRNLANAPILMASIIDGIFKESPETVILIAPIIFATPPVMQVNSANFNRELAIIIANRKQQGKHVLSVPIDILPGDLYDDKHPNNSGYEKMAEAWYRAIIDAFNLGWVKSPPARNPNDYPGLGLGIGDTDTCSVPKPGRRGSLFARARIWEEVGTIRTPVTQGARDKVILADLNNDVRAWLNTGTPNVWTSLGAINPPWSSMNITGDMVRMVDVDNDGKADLVVLYNDGSAKVWRNTNNGKSFTPLDSNWAAGFGDGERVRLKDMDGDGYADYVTVSVGGAVKWARNTHNNGKDASKKNWEEVQTIAPGVTGTPSDSTYLYDLNGDGKADYLTIFPSGCVQALTNTGNLNKNPNLRNWADLGTVAPGVTGVTGQMIRFADMDGDGLADFLAVAADGSIRMWRNLGIPGS